VQLVFCRTIVVHLLQVQYAALIQVFEYS